LVAFEKNIYAYTTKSLWVVDEKIHCCKIFGGLGRITVHTHSKHMVLGGQPAIP
jgi:hypothetical protein